MTGALLTLRIEAVAHGGHCVARHEGRVVFVRHALPGELVQARVTEDVGGAYCRADAITVLEPATGRVRPPCPLAGPGRCGGCDWQHADAPTQRELKRSVVLEQFQRLAGLDVAGLLPEVTALPGGLLGWRTRIAYAVAPDGTLGLRRHRSHDVLPVPACPLGVPGVGDADALRRTWSGYAGVEVARGEDEVALLGRRVTRRVTRGRPRGAQRSRPRRATATPVELLDGPPRLTHHVGDREFSVAAAGFWQVHPAALATFTAALLDLVRPQPGERVLELYAGAGALTAALAAAVGPGGQVRSLEASRTAVADAQANLADLPQVEVHRAGVDATTIPALGGPSSGPDLVVLDPPRTGAGRAVMTALMALTPRAIGYVACDPAALARDVQFAREAGWRLTALRAFDAFPMTHHMECVALLEPRSGPAPT